MKNKNLIRFVQSLVFVPIMFTGVHNTEISQNVLTQKFNIGADGTIFLNKAEIDPEVALQAFRVQKAAAIDAYFEKYEMPLQGTGMTFVLEAEKNELDWRLLPAISVRESTGGKFACKTKGYNSFGWGSCKIGFKSNEEAIATIAKNLGGNNPKTEHHYAGKTVEEILKKYNPPSIVPRYAEQVISIMDAIGDADIVPAPLAVANT
ncbi:hypothetical protein A3A03_01720 [Candidatus Nomurabacteria bacterium RIFCSPLOWO2_01_FULL_40_18]|uniref:Mannosyl-glycoprotein endo-beta-N-acetylglucosamidase-like domain-containing protein n=1 Tax=Candidatus Nomurabacteria bacterium RIFCSPLOWO2_01_FULL_40_18 TaxID=1801773 RepID=A0A1F6XIA0_9BACT|nr:MAG: hypothetical protein A3A03_01720 [Candidatus Nomurabacteria bacterium RIFCSPLOWO2_01_FULL_40_18]